MTLPHVGILVACGLAGGALGLWLGVFLGRHTRSRLDELETAHAALLASMKPTLPWPEFIRSVARGSRCTESTTGAVLTFLVDRPWVAKALSGYPQINWVMPRGPIPDSHPALASELSRGPL